MEKRIYKRVSLQDKGWHARLVDQVTGDVLGDIVNLSPGGMMLITSKDFEVESLHQVECHATSPGGKITRFTMGTMALWRAEASQMHTYWVGLQIIDIDEASRSRLLALGESMAASG